jgi:hypothetical protein
VALHELPLGGRQARHGLSQALGELRSLEEFVLRARRRPAEAAPPARRQRPLLGHRAACDAVARLLAHLLSVTGQGAARHPKAAHAVHDGASDSHPRPSAKVAARRRPVRPGGEQQTFAAAGAEIIEFHHPRWHAPVQRPGDGLDAIELRVKESQHGLAVSRVGSSGCVHGKCTHRNCSAEVRRGGAWR